MVVGWRRAEESGVKKVPITDPREEVPVSRNTASKSGVAVQSLFVEPLRVDTCWFDHPTQHSIWARFWAWNTVR